MTPKCFKCQGFVVAEKDLDQDTNLRVLCLRCLNCGARQVIKDESLAKPIERAVIKGQ